MTDISATITTILTDCGIAVDSEQYTRLMTKLCIYCATQEARVWDHGYYTGKRDGIEATSAIAERVLS